MCGNPVVECFAERLFGYPRRMSDPQGLQSLFTELVDEQVNRGVTGCAYQHLFLIFDRLPDGMNERRGFPCARRTMYKSDILAFKYLPQRLVLARIQYINRFDLKGTRFASRL